jgi:flagellar motor switch protein FliN/FliY
VRVQTQLAAVEVEITVLLGRALMPMQQLLRMGRGAVIQLDTHEDDQVWILANNHPIARGELVIEGDRISVNITNAAPVQDFFATEQ